MNGGRFIAAGGADGACCLWDVLAGSPVPCAVLPRDSASIVRELAWHPSRPALVTGSYRTINVWDASTGEKTAKIKGHTRAVAALALSPSGAVFASASADRTVQIFSSSTHHALHSIEFDHGVESVCFAGNDSVVAGVYSSELVVIDVGTGKIKAKLVHQTFASGVAVLP